MTTEKDDKHNGWNEWKNYVLENQKTANAKLDQLIITVNKLEVEMSAVKIKSGLLGTIAGGIGGAVAMGIRLLFGDK